jgi:hypothetical protein
MTDILEENEIIIIERTDLDGERIPIKYRNYINENTYIYRAKIIKICETKPYHIVKPIPLTDNEKDDFIGTRKGYKSKIYKQNCI